MRAFSPLGRPDLRLGVLYGLWDDCIAYQDGRLCPPDVFLWEHLQALGFECVAMLTHSELLFFDEASARAAMAAPTPIAARGGAARSLVAAPGGLSLRRASPAAPPAPVKRVYRGMQDSPELCGLLRRILTRPSPRTAVVFFAPSFLVEEAAGQTPVMHQIREILLTDFLARAPLGRHLVLLRVPARSLCELDHLLGRRGLGWLFGLDSEGRPTGAAEPIHLGGPSRDEVRALVDRSRVARGLRVDFARRDALEAELAAFARGAPKRLSELDAWIDHHGALDDALVAALTARRPGRSVWEELDALDGLSEVKAFFGERRRAVEALSRIEAPEPEPVPAFPERLCPKEPASGDLLHLLLTGAPGTGKTTVARLVGALYRELGLLPTGHLVAVTRKDLVAGYVGQTALRTADAVRRALGGVLFVDEAYDLCRGESDEFGREAVATLLEAMTREQGRFAVVAAGYPADVERFLRTNPGLPSRFAHRLHLPDLPSETLARIFLGRLGRFPAALCVDEPLRSDLPRLFDALRAQKGRDFGNAREAEQLAETAANAALGAGRLRVERADLTEESRRLLSAAPLGADGVLPELSRLVGLRTVKEQLRTLFARLAVERRRRPGARLAPRHYLFLGRPGTGKTTVARLMARQLHALGVVSRPSLHETSAARLLGRYVGETEEKTRSFLEAGLHGVIFVDEAHQLAGTDNEGSFGPRALEVLVPFAEDHREECALILAGYPEAMQRLLRRDPGLQERFSEHLEFEDYDDDEMVTICVGMGEERGIRWADGAEQELRREVARRRGRLGEDFANARTARKLVEECLDRQAARLAREGLTTGRLGLIELADIPGDAS